MALQRQISPLPAGRYWVDVVDGPGASAWVSYFVQHTPTGELVVERSDRLPNASGPSVTWMLFRTTAPTMWPKVMGFPTIAGDDVQSRPDTADNKPVTQPFEVLANALPYVGALAGAYLVLSFVKELRR